MLVNLNLIFFDTSGSHRFDSDVVFDEKREEKCCLRKKERLQW